MSPIAIPLACVYRTVKVCVGAIALKAVINKISFIFFPISESEVPKAVFSGSQETSNVSGSVPVEKGPVALLEIF